MRRPSAAFNTTVPLETETSSASMVELPEALVQVRVSAAETVDEQTTRNMGSDALRISEIIFNQRGWGRECVKSLSL